jgi:hypothetical protein
MRFFFLISLCIFLQNSFAQLNCKTLKQSDTTIVKCFHKNGKLSVVKEEYKQRTGKVTGYDAKGKMIFELHTRKFAGHAYTDIEYYGNGQVKKVYYSSAPDAGIQWYHLTIEYNENGVETYRQEQSNEDLLRPSFVIKQYDSTFKPYIQKPVVPEVYVNEYYLINTSNKLITLTKNVDSINSQQQFLIYPKDTLLFTSESSSNRFKPINRNPNISLKVKKKKLNFYVGELILINNRLQKQYFLLF